MKYKFYLIIFMLLISIILFKGYIFSSKYISDDAEKEYTVFVQSLKTKSDTKVSYNVKLLGTSNKFILNIYDNSYDNIEIDLSKLANYTYGDVIKINGKISIPQKLSNPGEFDYKLYLYSNNIYGLINTYEIPKKIEYNLNFVERIFFKIYRFKQNTKELIKCSMQENNANVAMSIIYGDMVDLDKEVKENFEDIGVSHLMSVSGTHITSFMIIVNTLLAFNNQHSNKKKMRKQENFKSKIIGIIQIFAILIYMLFTGFSISVLRAGIMLMISIVCNMLSLKKNKYVVLLLTLIIILLYSPFAIFNAGMQLSFLATFGILMFGKKIATSLYKLTNKIKNNILEKTVKYVINNISITIAVQLLIIPVEVQTFNKLPFPIIIPNLILGLISAQH